MKIEPGGTLVDNSVLMVSLNDPTLVPEKVIVWVDGTYPSHGYDDLTTQVCIYNSYLTKNNKSIYVYNGSTVLLEGKCTSFDEGEIVFTFTTHSELNLRWLVIGS